MSTSCRRSARWSLSRDALLSERLPLSSRVCEFRLSAYCQRPRRLVRRLDFLSTSGLSCRAWVLLLLSCWRILRHSLRGQPIYLILPRDSLLRDVLRRLLVWWSFLLPFNPGHPLPDRHTLKSPLGFPRLLFRVNKRLVTTPESQPLYQVGEAPQRSVRALGRLSAARAQLHNLLARPLRRLLRRAALRVSSCCRPMRRVILHLSLQLVIRVSGRKTSPLLVLFVDRETNQIKLSGRRHCTGGPGLCSTAVLRCINKAVRPTSIRAVLGANLVSQAVFPRVGPPHPLLCVPQLPLRGGGGSDGLPVFRFRRSCFL